MHGLTKNITPSRISISPSDFDYELPEGLIARYPQDERDASRLMFLSRCAPDFKHESFRDILSHVRKGDLFIFNDTRVIPARLRGKKSDGGGAVELLLVRDLGGGEWLCMSRSSKGFRQGVKAVFSEGSHHIEAEFVGDEGNGFGRFSLKSKDLKKAVEALGSVPLPPYLNRDAEEIDKERYQSVFAKNDGAIAAPTASLHFTPSILGELGKKGVDIRYVTLHTGPATFLPIREGEAFLSVPAEQYFISAETAEAVIKTKKENRRVVAVGSTVVRTLETAFSAGIDNPALNGDSSLFITPGFEFKAVDVLVTNFHLPKSTLLMMVAAFAGKDIIMRAYREAVERKYRFFSYGDCMLIE